MAPEPQEPISQFTEISDNHGLARTVAFLSAMSWGTLMCTASLLASVVFHESGGLAFVELVAGLAFLTIIVSLFTLAGMVAIGLPVTWLLRSLCAEHAWLYAALGSIAGFTIIALLIGLSWVFHPPFFGFAVSGALAGLACAYRWGRWRERVAKARQVQREELEAQKPPNPIHDLIH